MDSARKFVALALAACHSRQYEEAGIFLVQASKEPGSKQLAQELGEDETQTSISEDANVDAQVEATPEDGDGETDDEDVEDATTKHLNGDDAPDDDDWGDEPNGASEDSVSSGARRKSTSLFRIGKIMAAAMSVSSDDGDEEEGDDEENDEVDTDFAGETLVPVSFSSVKVKTSV